jgi:hypothetical protein
MRMFLCMGIHQPVEVLLWMPMLRDLPTDDNAQDTRREYAADVPLSPRRVDKQLGLPHTHRTYNT